MASLVTPAFAHVAAIIANEKQVVWHFYMRDTLRYNCLGFTQKKILAYIFQSICLIEINNYIEEKQNKRKCWKWKKRRPKMYL